MFLEHLALEGSLSMGSYHGEWRGHFQGSQVHVGLWLDNIEVMTGRELNEGVRS